MQGTLDDKGVVLRCGSCGARNRLKYADLAKPAQCGQCKSALGHPDGALAVPSESAFHAAARESALPVLVDFWASWCGPCKMMAPEFEQAARALSGEALLLKVNTEDLPRLAAEFRISSIPTLILLNQGREISREAGARPAAGIVSFLREHERGATV